MYFPYYKSIVIQNMWQWYKESQINKWNPIESTKKDPETNYQLILDKNMIVSAVEKGKTFQHLVLEELDNHMHRMNS
jgi:hypothetical protein